MGALSHGLEDWSKCDWSRPYCKHREAVTIVTCNSTSWHSAQAQIEAWLAECWVPRVILLQQHHLPAARCSGALAWCLSQGYMAHFNPAVPTDKGGTMGGTAVLWQSPLEATPIHTPPSLAGRFAGVRLTGLYSARCIVGSVYLQVGQTKERLMQQLTALAGILHQGHELVLLGGDWNYERAHLEELGWAQRTDLRLVGIGAPTVKWEIDFFAVDGLLQHKSDTILRAPLQVTTPHPAIRLDLNAASSDDRHYEVVKAPRLPVKRPHAPPQFAQKPKELVRTCSTGDLEVGWHAWSHDAAKWMHLTWAPEAGAPKACSLKRSRALRLRECRLSERLQTRRRMRCSALTIAWLAINRWVQQPDSKADVPAWSTAVGEWSWHGKNWTMSRLVSTVSWSQPFLEWL
eukprot:6492365-Amphidinium_carterae.1